jgi:CPA2 family monovalent cation:H+ antiporter-2
MNPSLPVLARTRDDSNLEKLMALGATEVIPETHEASLTLVSHLLLMMNVPSRQIHTMIDEARRNRYHMLHGFYHGERVGLLNRKEKPVILHAVRLTGLASACGKEISMLKLPDDVRVTELKRGNETFSGEALMELTLQRGDVMVLQGTIDEIDLAESVLLRG